MYRCRTHKKLKGKDTEIAMEGESNFTESYSYKECQRNFAAALGMQSTDGCSEYISDISMPQGMFCQACQCHRNFHRKVLVQAKVAANQDDNMNKVSGLVPDKSVNGDEGKEEGGHSRSEKMVPEKAIESDQVDKCSSKKEPKSSKNISNLINLTNDGVDQPITTLDESMANPEKANESDQVDGFSSKKESKSSKDVRNFIDLTKDEEDQPISLNQTIEDEVDRLITPPQIRLNQTIKSEVDRQTNIPPSRCNLARDPNPESLKTGKSKSCMAQKINNQPLAKKKRSLTSLLTCSTSKKPKKPLNSFIIFMEDFRETYCKEHPDNKDVKVVGIAGGEKWRLMSDAEKAPYKSKEVKMKAEYDKKLRAYEEEIDGATGEDDDDYLIRLMRMRSNLRKIA